MQLNDFQTSFKALMLDEPDALLDPPEALAGFCMEGNFPLSERLKIYRNNIIGSLTDMMVATFPVLEKLVGKDFLEGMSRSFILEHPPTQGCMSAYGAGFAEFISIFQPATHLPYLPDIARMEMAYNEAYYARDDLPLDAAGLAAIAPEDLADTILHVRDHVQILSSAYPLEAIRDFCFAEDQSVPPDFNQGGGHFMIYRPEYQSIMLQIDEAEFAMLELLQRGTALGEAVEAVLETHSAFDFAGFLQKYLSLETFLMFEANR